MNATMPGTYRLRSIAFGLLAASLIAALFFTLPEPGDKWRNTETAPPFAIVNVRVFDGERLLERANVIVRDGRIEAIGEELVVPEWIPAIEGSGHTLLPGLIDAHVHTFDAALADSLRFGVTTVLDMFTDPAILREIKPARESLAPLAHADLYSAGWLATAPGGHGTQFGMPIPTLTHSSEAAEWVDARIQEGSDYIKIIYEPRDSQGRGPPFPSLDSVTMAALVEAAHARGRLAVAHVSRLEATKEALMAGVDGLVHIFADRPPDDELITLIRQRNAFVVPTLAITYTYNAGDQIASQLAEDPRIRPFLTPAQKNVLAATREELPFLKPEIALQAVQKLHVAGVDILAGSDAPNAGTTHGATLHQELELLVQAGLTESEALAAATSVPARRFGLQDRGRIAPGMRADLVLVRGDPTRDIKATRAIERIWKNGAQVNRRQYAPAP